MTDESSIVVYKRSRLSLLGVLALSHSSFPATLYEMATKTLEARFEHLTVNDENETPPSPMLKSKVLSLQCAYCPIC